MEPRIRLLASTLIEAPPASQDSVHVVEDTNADKLLRRLSIEDPPTPPSESEDERSEESEDESEMSSDSSQSPSNDSNISLTSQPPKAHSQRRPKEVSAILQAQLSPDGTCVFTSDYYRNFSVYIIDADILEADIPRRANPHARLSSSLPIRAFAAPAWFSLSNWEQAPVLISRESNYITLHRALYGPSTITDDPSPGPIDISAVGASYKIIDHLTEAVIAPHSLAFTSDGTHFLAGSKNQISLFDLNYTDEPVHKQRTIPSARNNLKGGGVGFKGTVSALGMACSSNMFAAGTWEGHVGLYRAVEGAIEAITHFPLPRKYRWFSREDAHTQALRGSGVTQLKFSPCEKYLYIAERKSDAIAVYDVRNMSIGLGHCAGRKALTNQKFGFDIYPTGSGHEIWAGGIDGAVRVWKDPHCQEGAIEPDYCLSLDQGPVVSTIIHPCGNLTITATGSIEVEDPEEDDFVRTNEIYPKYRTQGSLNMFELGTGTDQAVLQE